MDSICGKTWVPPLQKKKVNMSSMKKVTTFYSSVISAYYCLISKVKTIEFSVTENKLFFHKNAHNFLNIQDILMKFSVEMGFI